MRSRVAGLALSVAVSLLQPLLDPSPAVAVDGVIEINQAKALAGGVTPGDTPGFPVLVTAPGSYRLTGNLDLRPLGLPASANTDAIWIVSSVGGITIDLNGFSILGPALCDPSNPPCTDTGTGIGVRSNTQNFLEVTNGTVFGMGSHGVSILAGRVVGLVAESNGGDGIQFDNGVVEGSQALRNGGNGIYANLSGSIARSSARRNLLAGVAGTNARLESCQVETNLGRGIDLLVAVVTSSLVNSNGNEELFCQSNCAIDGNLFEGCLGAACFGGAGTITQIPAGSNRCGADPCP